MFRNIIVKRGGLVHLLARREPEEDDRGGISTYRDLGGWCCAWDPA